jgi:hypothetical protein
MLEAIVVIEGIITPNDVPARIKDKKKMLTLCMLSKINETDKRIKDRSSISLE